MNLPAGVCDAVGHRDAPTRDLGRKQAATGTLQQQGYQQDSTGAQGKQEGAQAVEADRSRFEPRPLLAEGAWVSHLASLGLHRCTCEMALTAGPPS